MIKFNYSILIVTMSTIFVTFLFGGCITSKYTAPELPPWQVATIKSADTESVRIYSVDGLLAKGELNGKRVSELPGSVIVSSGQHKIVPCFINRDSTLIYGEPIRFYSQQEQDYTIRHKIKWNKKIRFWIEHNGVDITTE